MQTNIPNIGCRECNSHEKHLSWIVLFLDISRVKSIFPLLSAYPVVFAMVLLIELTDLVSYNLRLLICALVVFFANRKVRYAR